jgi:hypothetical protein
VFLGLFFNFAVHSQALVTYWGCAIGEHFCYPQSFLVSNFPALSAETIDIVATFIKLLQCLLCCRLNIPLRI